MAEHNVKKTNAGGPDLSDEMKKTRWVLRILSVAFAVALWIFVTWDGTALSTREIAVPLKFADLLDGYSATSATRDVKVVIEGRQELLAFGTNTITASVGMQDLRPGKYRLPVQVSVPESTRLVSCTPRFVEFELFRIIERTLQPRLAPPGDLPDGYSLEEFETIPSEVTVRGSESEVTSIRRAEIQGTFKELRSGLAKELPVLLMGEKDVVRGLAVKPEKVQVRAVFTESFEEKTVPVRAITTGSPTAALEVSSITVSPDFVTLRGPRGELQDISEIRLNAIDVSNASEDMDYDVPLIAQGSKVTVLGSPYAHVRVEFHSAVERYTFLNVPIAVRGRGVYENWDTVPSRADVTIEWSAVPGMSINRTNPPFELYVDVTNVVSQRISLPLLVKDLPLGIKIIRLEPEQITIRAIIP